MQRLGMEEGVPIESRFVSKQIENAQKRVEGQNFGYRKHVLEYDDVMNKQREAVYGLRRQLLEGEDQKEYLMGIADDIMIELVGTHARENTARRRMGPRTACKRLSCSSSVSITAGGRHRSHPDEFQGTRRSPARQSSREIRSEGSADRRRQRCAITNACSCCRSWTSHWKDHLLAMDHLKEGIGLRGYGQRDPLVEYKKESYDLFEGLMGRIEEDTLRFLFLLQPVEEKKQAEQIETKRRQRRIRHVSAEQQWRR